MCTSRVCKNEQIKPRQINWKVKTITTAIPSNLNVSDLFLWIYLLWITCGWKEHWQESMKFAFSFHFVIYLIIFRIFKRKSNFWKPNVTITEAVLRADRVLIGSIRRVTSKKYETLSCRTWNCFAVIYNHI